MATAYLKNENDHGVRAGGVRIPAGGVAAVDNEDAANVLSASNGVSKASKSDYESYRDENAVKTGGGSPGSDLHDSLRRLRQAHRQASVSAPLQIVVGDDDAPLGPPTGTVTTKQAVAQNSAKDKDAFADHEQAEVGENASEIEQRQAENTREAEEVASELADVLQGKGPDRDEDEPEPQG